MRPLTSSTYLGIDVLDGPSDPKGPSGDSPSRRITLVDPGPGLLWADAHEALPRYRRTLRIWCRDAAELADLIGWLDLRRGRALPFWLPSWDADLTLLSPYAPEDGPHLEIWGAGYGESMWPAGPSRRHFLVRGPSGVLYYRSVLFVEVLEFGSAGQQNLDLSEPLPEALPSGTSLSFLRYCRLDVDEARIVFTRRLGMCELPIVELPQECPA